MAAGGLLVVLPVPVESRIVQSHCPYDNHSWWAIDVAEPYPGTPSIVAPGSGMSVAPTGSGSEFEEYLEQNQGFQARLGSWFEDRDTVDILAHNRAGGPVAAEVAVGAGTVICVPPPINAKAAESLLRAVESFLSHRFGPGLKWPLPEEEELARARQGLLGEFHAEMAEVTSKQRVVQERKRSVFAITQVDRGVRYFQQATRSGSTPRQIMTALYSLIEMLKYYYDTDWNGLADRLGVSHKSVDRIEILANRPETHMRHVNASDPEGVDQVELDRVIDDARAIMSSFIAREHADEISKTPQESPV